MHHFLSSYKENKKIFLGATASYTIIQHGYSVDQLMLKIKMATLLYDVVFIPAAYMWQSEQMKEVMIKIQPLILTENVLPIIRKTRETRDIKDYFERRQYETKNIKNMDVFKIPSLATEIADDNDREDMLFLNRIDSCLHLEEKSVKEEFINLWINDLLTHGDINAISMILYIGLNDHELYKMIINELKNNVDYENFSRSMLIDYILKFNISSNMKLRLQERISWLYLKANAKASQSDFYLSRCNNSNLIYKANLDLYLELLKKIGINKNMIHLLSLEELLSIKDSEEYLNFIINYNRLIENIYYEQSDLINKINKRIDKIISKQYIKHKFFYILQFIYKLSGSLFINLLSNYFSGSEVNNIVFGGSGATTLSAFFLHKLVAINKSISDTSFYDFKEYIMKEKYKEKMQKTINRIRL